ncbi:hypothetical protein GCM10027570_36420 [Streptomonospora sediminis]
MPGLRAWRTWRPWALLAICALAAGLYTWGIGDSWGNSYYSAAVKSMSQSFENFFFGSLDAAGVITVDKPPMALWLQVASVKLFGFSRLAIQLPQAVAGVAAVFLLHRTVRRWAGEHAALLAALILALTPITVAINRINNPDTLLVLLVVGAAYAMTRAITGPRATGWLALAALLVGCGFLTKMLQAWMVLPAFVLAYLVASRAPWVRKVLDLAVAGAVLVAGSFWWVAATALWPGGKPYIGGSEDGSAWDLVFGYNGFGRVFGGGMGGGQGPGGGAPPGMAAGSGAAEGGPGGGGGGPGGGFSGDAGLLRMFNDQLAGQVSWLLPLCGLVLAAVCASGILRLRAGRPLDREGAAGWVLWGGWLLVVGLVLSFAQGIMHPYYTTMLAPAIGAIAGAGLVRLWGWYRRSAGKARLLLPIAVAATACWALAVVMRNPGWHAWAGYAAMALAAAALVAILSVRRTGRAVPARSALALVLAAVLMVPAAWSAIAAAGAQGGMNGTNPMAGPATGMGGPGGGPGGQGGSPGGAGGMQPPGAQDGQDGSGGSGGQDGSGDADGSDGSGAQSGTGGTGSGGDGTGSGSGPARAGTGQGAGGGAAAPGGLPGGGGGGSEGSLSADQQALLDHVESAAGDRKVALAVQGGAMGAASYIIASDAAVVAMGGFTGGDDAPSTAQLSRWQESGELGFVLLGSGMGGGPGGGGGAAAMPGAGNAQGTQQSASGGSATGPPGMQESGNDRAQWAEQHCDPVDPSVWGGSQDSAQRLYSCG